MGSALQIRRPNYANAVELAHRLNSDDADVYAAALLELRDLIAVQRVIQYVEEALTELDPYVDITENGGPNLAMRITQILKGESHG
jgi:hypothetical protein